MTEISFAEQVFEDIEKFFSEGGSNDNDLLRIACRGNPERTIQGSLFLHLSKKFHVVLEIKTEGNSTDIAIFKEKKNIMPDVLIELKHRSPFQTGGFNSLLYARPDKKGLRHDMFKDYFKHRSIDSSNTPALILIGAATTIYRAISDIERDNQNLPFLKTKGYTPKSDQKLNTITEIKKCLFKMIAPWPKDDVENWYGRNTLPKDCIPPEPTKCFYRLNSGTLGHIRHDQTPTSDLGNHINGSVHAIGFMWS